MAYVSLYRKYRPQTFSDTEMVGQAHIIRTLQHAIAAGRVSHAYLFCGPRGTGKTTTARLLAKALNCDSGPTPTPCDKCPPCEAIREGTALDVLEIDAASNRGIDEIRNLRERVSFAPAADRYKVYIIDEVHMLTNEACNALLKTLEEPPAHVVFVMATTEAHRLPPTILSRCQRFDFHRLPIPDIIGRLQAVCAGEGIEITEPALSLLARAAEGSMRDALSLLEQAYAYAAGAIGPEEVQAILGGVDSDLLLEFGQVVAAQDGEGAFRLIERAVSEGKDMRALVGELVEHFRHLLLLATVRGGESLVALPPATLARLQEQARTVSPDRLVGALEVLAEAERELRWATQQRLVLELALVKLCRPTEALPRPAEAVARPAEAATPARVQPAPAPLAAEAPSAAPGSTELEQMREQWAGILQALRRNRQAPIAAFLTKAYPAEVSGNVLTLAFRERFHYDAMSRRVGELEKLLERDFNLKLSVRCIMEEGTEAQKQPTGPSVIVRNVLSVFPGSSEIGH